MNNLFYIQDSRGYVGDNILWWRENERGYTTDISDAGIYSEHVAQSIHNNRNTDIPWSKEYIDNHACKSVDRRLVSHSTAIIGTNLVIATPKPPINRPYHCTSCGQFISTLRWRRGDGLCVVCYRKR